MKRNRWIHTGIGLLGLILLSYCMCIAIPDKERLHEFPSYIHAWTQSDRYALAEGFVENGGDLFHPQTRNLKPNFVGTLEQATGITAVDLPLPEYIASLLMRITGDTGPLWCRLVTWLFGIMGMYALFRIVYDETRSALSLIPVLLAFTSPVWMYYLQGFIPTVPAVALSLAGCRFYLREKRIEGLLLCTLAAMIRLPLLIPLMAIFIADIPAWRKQPRQSLHWGLCLLLYSSWFCWNRYLYNHYGSMFLGLPLIAGSFSELKEHLLTGFNNWKYHIFSSYQYLLILLVFLTGLLTGRKTWFRSPTLRIGLISLAGGCCYMLLMSPQYVYHDYYFLDAFFVPVFLLMASALVAIHHSGRRKMASAVLVIATLVLLPSFTTHLSETLEKRRETGPWDRYRITLENVENGARLLDSLAIPETEPVVILDAYSTNAPLILLKRKGYTVLSTTPEEIQNAMALNVRIYVVQDLFLRSDVLPNAPQLLRQLRRLGGNGRISVYRKEEDTVMQTEEQFTGVDGLTLHDRNDRPAADSNWTNLPASGFPVELKNQEYGPTYTAIIPPGKTPVLWLDANVSFDSANRNVECVFRFLRPGVMMTYSFNLIDYAAGRKTFPVSFLVPFETSSEPAKVEFFLYNPARQAIQIDSLALRLYLRSPIL